MNFGVLSLRSGAEPLPIEATEDDPVVIEALSGTILVVDELDTQSTLGAAQTTTVTVPVAISAVGGDAMVDVRPESEIENDEEDDD